MNVSANCSSIAQHTLQHARLTHDGFGFLLDLPRDLEGIALLEPWQEQFDGQRSRVALVRERSEHPVQRCDAITRNDPRRVVEEFARHAETLLLSLGFSNVGIRVGDGSRGWAEHAPFDKILLTVAARRTPPALLDQLKPGGRVVLPLGPEEAQLLTVIDKDASGELKSRTLIPVRFSQLETM